MRTNDCQSLESLPSMLTSRNVPVGKRDERFSQTAWRSVDTYRDSKGKTLLITVFTKGFVSVKLDRQSLEKCSSMEKTIAGRLFTRGLR